jgi:glycerol-3-phosphate dehydrogenase
MDRTKNLQTIASQSFDVCVIGAGATGAGCALDATLRGLKVILVEKKDFAAETSSKSTKLIHGGVRYLEQAVKKLSYEQFKLVRKALLERQTLLRNAPHLTRPLALVTPCYGFFSQAYYFIGLKVYDWLSGRKSIGKSIWLTKRQTLQHLSTLRGDRISGGVLYWDGQLDDTRYVLGIVKTAAKNGCTILNHVQADGFGKADNGHLNRLYCTDTLTGEKHRIQAKIFINAAGPYADHLRQAANAALLPRMRVSKGAHFVLKDTLLNGGNTALLIPKTDDGRVLFVIPWQHQLLVGTTDTEAELSPHVELERADADYMLTYLRRYFVGDFERSQIRAGFAGLRPLLQADPSADTATLVRDHEVETDAASQLISIMGGKWTTYRLMAQDTIDVVEKRLQIPLRPCSTAQTPLVGSEMPSDEVRKQLSKLSIPQNIMEHLTEKYGSDALKMNFSDNLTLLHSDYPHTQQELYYNVSEEMAFTIEDVLSRRWGLTLTDWTAASTLTNAVGAGLQMFLGWSNEMTAQQISDFRAKIAALALD